MLKNLLSEEEIGFNFGNCRRNQNFIESGFEPPKTTKTGTTICGVTFQGGVVVGADSRSTSSGLVIDKKCEKIHYIQDNIYCCGAGTSADLNRTTNYVSANMELLRMNTNRKYVPVVAAVTFAKQYLFRFQGHIKSYLIFGGVDYAGPHIYQLHAHGSTDRLPYSTLGSGCLPAMAVLEARWNPNLNEEEAKTLVRDAITAGILSDLGSGSHVDLCIIRKNSHQYLRAYDVIAKREGKGTNYTPKRGATAVLSQSKIDIEITEEIDIDLDEMKI